MGRDEHHMVMISTVSKGFCFCERYADGVCVRNRAKLSGWIVDSQEFRDID